MLGPGTPRDVCGPNVRVKCFQPFRRKSRVRLEDVSATVLEVAHPLTFADLGDTQTQSEQRKKGISFVNKMVINRSKS